MHLRIFELKNEWKEQVFMKIREWFKPESYGNIDEFSLLLHIKMHRNNLLSMWID